MKLSLLKARAKWAQSQKQFDSDLDGIYHTCVSKGGDRTG